MSLQCKGATCDGKPLDWKKGVYLNEYGIGLVERDLYTKKQALIGVVPLKKACVKCRGPSTLVCGRCCVVSYCSPSCQREDWKVHKSVCIQVFSPESEDSQKLRHSISLVHDQPLLRFALKTIYNNFATVRDGSSDIVIYLSPDEDQTMNYVPVFLSPNSQDQARKDAIRAIGTSGLGECEKVSAVFSFGDGLPAIRIFFPIYQFGLKVFVTDARREDVLAVRSCFTCQFKARLFGFNKCTGKASATNEEIYRVD